MEISASDVLSLIFLAEATLRKHRGGRSYIAFKFSFTGNRLLLNTRYSEIHIFQSPYCFFSFFFSVLISLSKWTRFFASLVKRNFGLKFFIRGTCSGVDRLKLPLKNCQKSDSVCSVFEMTNVIVIKKRNKKFFLFLPSHIMKASGAWRVLECSQRNSLPSGLDNCLELSKQPLAFIPGYANTEKNFLLPKS